MDQEKFFDYLRKGGRKPDVAERVIRLVCAYASYLEDHITLDLDTAVTSDLDAFVTWVEQQKAGQPNHENYIPSARSYLWAIRYYYRFTGNDNMARHASLLREARIKRKPFAIKDFRGVETGHVNTLKRNKIININQMLKAGKTPDMRKQLAEDTGIPEETILELVRLSDLARIPGIKSIRARLYHDAGITSIKQLAAMQAEEILEITRIFVDKKGFDGIPPLPGEVDFSINKAKKLPIVVEE